MIEAIKITETIDWIDILWTAIAVVGLFLWLKNLRQAMISLRAVKQMKISNGRRLWARFSVYLTSTMVTIELVFLGIGISSMIRAAGTETSQMVARWVTIFLFLLVTAAITVLAYRWGEVDREILRLAQKNYLRKTPESERM